MPYLSGYGKHTLSAKALEIYYVKLKGMPGLYLKLSCSQVGILANLRKYLVQSYNCIRSQHVPLAPSFNLHQSKSAFPHESTESYGNY
jgi:hypothetical protein